LLKLLTILLFTTSALAQSDAYWQQLYSSSQGQCAASLVSLAKQLDDAKKQIEDLKKQLEGKH
jgi:hypothetical protein